MKMILLTQSSGKPILLSDAGLTIEPEVEGRCSVIMPHSNRQPPRVVITESFGAVCAALRHSGLLIDTGAPAEKREATDAVEKPAAEAELEIPVEPIVIADSAEAAAAIQARFDTKKRPRAKR